jgi:hypothetical protein
LKRLYDFDPDLVLIPSRKKVVGENPAYLLTRRRSRSAGLGDVAMLDNQHPDTNMCYAHGVLPIAPLRWTKKGRSGTFTMQSIVDLIEELKKRDMWAITGGATAAPDKIWQDLEDAERYEADKQRLALRDKFYHMARDAWRSIKARTGQRNKTTFDGNRHANIGAARDKRRIIVPVR